MAMLEALALMGAVSFGLLARWLNLPPLVGFLVAGFALHALDERFDLLPAGAPATIEHIAHMGVVLLLFSVGLKLKVGQLLKPVVLGGGLIHVVISIALFSVPLLLLSRAENEELLLVALALSFSSTVLVVKMLEAQREVSAFHGRVAIGILIVQDLIALVALTVWGGAVPSPWAFALLALPLLRPLLYRMLSSAGHEELLLLVGVLLALVLGGGAFAAVGLSGELGALVVGVLVGGHPRARELANSMWSLKELFLVGFFLQIGLAGLPTLEDWLIAAGLLLALPLKGLLFFALLVAFRLRARSAFLAALALTAYSEFGLIVASGLPMLEAWLVPLALAVALSFMVSAPANRAANTLFERFEPFLTRFQRTPREGDEQPTNLVGVRALVFGMGRTGTAAYNSLVEVLDDVVGVDSDPYRVEENGRQGRRVVMADAEDVDFWRALDVEPLRAVVLAMDDINAKLVASRQLRKLGFKGPIVAHAMYAEHVEQLREAGADETHLTLHEAGKSLATQAMGRLDAPG